MKNFETLNESEETITRKLLGMIAGSWSVPVNIRVSLRSFRVLYGRSLHERQLRTASSVPASRIMRSKRTLRFAQQRTRLTQTQKSKSRHGKGIEIYSHHTNDNKSESQ